ncbi:hypothetical protein DM45_3329 [Burkholderia mallei]|nr:hypothetical protein DM45_3329 [Burkholderia mallei]KOT11310.1 hypothetical protein DM77_2825 [Burkholderia mallei]
MTDMTPSFSRCRPAQRFHRRFSIEPRRLARLTHVNRARAARG